MTSVAAYIRRETAVSALINAVISAGFAVAVFRGESAVVWGGSGFVADFVPQGFMVALMAFLVPTLLARRAVSSGRVSGGLVGSGKGHLVLPALLAAVMGAVILTAVMAALFAALGIETIPFVALLSIKVASGAILGALVTSAALSRLLR